MVVFQHLHSVTRCHFRRRIKGGSRVIVLLCISTRRLLVIVRDIFFPQASKKREPSPARRVALLMPSCLKYSPQSSRSRYASQEAWGYIFPEEHNAKWRLQSKAKTPGKLEIASERFSLRLRGPTLSKIFPGMPEKRARAGPRALAACSRLSLPSKPRKSGFHL